ncbi:hypothetical protein B0H11DRAFT_2250201 [Mycena galericulata]|nr:hypothetical protein B0H11DRAFT_2250201 [Mycena galericulata]
MADVEQLLELEPCTPEPPPSPEPMVRQAAPSPASRQRQKSDDAGIASMVFASTHLDPMDTPGCYTVFGGPHIDSKDALAHLAALHSAKKSSEPEGTPLAKDALTLFVAPVASAKPKDEMDAHIRSRQQILKIAAEMSMAAYEEAPKETRERLQERASLVNAPSLGCDGNRAYGAYQLNLATAQSDHDNVNMQKDLGFFGGAHSDLNDTLGAY